MDIHALRTYLHEHIPLSKAMGVDVVEATAEGVALSAPLSPNINHRETVFGGSAAAVALLAAWSLLYLRLREVDMSCRLVIHKSAVVYEKPMAGTFFARTVAPDAAAWHRFVSVLARRHRARIVMRSVLSCDGVQAGELEGEFVALAPEA
jgi:thioesterase domain-containing protein